MHSDDPSLPPPLPDLPPYDEDDENPIAKLSNQIFELENVIRLKDDQLEMKDERSFIKDETILNLRNELNEQYIKADEKIRELTKQLDEAKSNQDFFDNPGAELSKKSFMSKIKVPLLCPKSIETCFYKILNSWHRGLLIYH